MRTLRAILMTFLATGICTAAETDASSRCDLTEASFAGKPVTTKINGWTVFLGKPEAEGEGNSFQVCLNRSQSIVVPGIPYGGPYGERTIHRRSGRLLIEKLDPTGLIAPKDIPGGKVIQGRFVAVNGSAYGLSGRSTYNIPDEELSTGSIKSLGGISVPIDRMTSVRYHTNLPPTSD